MLQKDKERKMGEKEKILKRDTSALVFFFQFLLVLFLFILWNIDSKTCYILHSYTRVCQDWVQDTKAIWGAGSWK